MLKGGDVIYSPVLRSQSFGEPVPLDCELPKSFAGLFSPRLGGTAWPEPAGVGHLLFPRLVRL